MNKYFLAGFTLLLSTGSYAVDTFKPDAEYTATYQIYKIKGNDKDLITSSSTVVKANQETPLKIEKSLGNEISVATEGLEVFTTILKTDKGEKWEFKGTVTTLKSVSTSKDLKWAKLVSETVAFRNSMNLNKGEKTEYTSSFEQDGSHYLLKSSILRLK